MQVEGEVFNKIWGIDKRNLQYGTHLTKEGVEKPLSYTGYFITHLPTGALLTHTRTLKAAKLLLSEPEFFDEKLTGKRTGAAVKRFFDACGWRD